MPSEVIDIQAIKQFLDEIDEVTIRRDLGTATLFGARLNRIISNIDRHLDQLTPSQRALVDLAHGHIREMMNCPRRMRLDDTWQDDFVGEATKAAEALLSAGELSGSN